MMTTLETEQLKKENFKMHKSNKYQTSWSKMYKYKISVTSGNILRKSKDHVSMARYPGGDGANLQNISPQIQHDYFYVFYQHMFAYTE